LNFIQRRISIPVEVDVRATQGAFWYALLSLLCLVLAALFAVIVQGWKLLRKNSKLGTGKMGSSDTLPDNEPVIASFGLKEEWEQFSTSHQVLLRKLPLLFKTFGRAFLRTMETTNPADRVIYFLGRIAMEDFMEIALLCGNGYGVGAQKILRGLYERAVTAAYLAKYPKEVDSFLDYHQVHMGKLVNHAAELFDLRSMFSEDKLAEIRERYEEAKQHFQEPLCKKCGTTRTQFSWSKLDVGAMAKKADEYLAKLYLECYFLPTLQTHATFHALSAQARQSAAGGLTYDDNAQREAADRAFRGAHLTMLFALGTQNCHFKLGLEEELVERRGDFAEAWGKTPDEAVEETVPE
jgi:hypothetical protein